MEWYWISLIVFGCAMAPFLLVFVFSLLYYRCIRGIKPPKGEYQNVGHGSKLKRLFFDFPRQWALDHLTFDPDYFREYGVHMIAGEQGSGKTITLVYMLNRWKRMYPRLQVHTNFNYVYQDAPIDHWHDLIDNTNGIYGVVDCIDEIQNWFNSLESKDFPVEMITEITQQRKQRRAILTTSQVFSRVSKPIREQTYFLYMPITLFGCLTVVRKYKPTLSPVDGQAREKKLRGVFFFVHNRALRESYDTYLKIQKMRERGFKGDVEQMRDEGQPINLTVKKKRVVMQ